MNDEQQNPSNLYEPLNNVMVRNTKIANTFGAFVKIPAKVSLFFAFWGVKVYCDEKHLKSVIPVLGLLDTDSADILFITTSLKNTSLFST